MNSPETSNPYMHAPLPRVRNDAIYGVALARRAWRSRDPQGAAKELGRTIEPSPAADATQARQKRVVSAVGDYLSTAPGRRRPAGRRDGVFTEDQDTGARA